jgi:WD40 repeat protein
MTRDKTSPAPVDERLLAQVMACDALLHVSSTAPERRSAGPPSASEADDLARSRLLLLLRMLDAGEPPAESPEGASAGPGGEVRPEGRPLLGRFDVLDDLGSGGFGFVVHARDRLLGRDVALKMPLPERLLAPEDVHRFLREARAAARLDHPHIVRVHDAGDMGPLGYFIASEFCPGPNLRRWLKAQNEPVPVRLAARWIAALAAAVQHAHDRGILHRDIKPDNVILAGGPVPEDFIPRLTDFGLAKLVAEAGDETRSEARLGTPHYMAPEQAAGHRREVGPATDVYALGATLYEVLTGRPPLRGETDAMTLRLILEADPVPPRSLRPGLPREVETIALKCLRKEPARRYSSAAALGEDLQRFLDGRPILGRPVSALEEARGWARRRPAVTALLGLVVVLVVVLVGGIVAWASWLGSHNRRLETQVARADRQTQEAEKQTRLAEDRRSLAERHSYAASLRRARQALDAHQSELAQDILHDIRPEPEGRELRGFAWHYLWRQAHREFSQLRGHRALISDWSISPDGMRLATRDVQGKVLVWDLLPGGALGRPRAALSAPSSIHNWLQFSPDGRYLAKLSWGPEITVIDLFEPASGDHVARHRGEVSEFLGRFSFDAASRRLAMVVGRRDGTGLVRWWDLADPRREPHAWRYEGGGGWFAPDGRFLATIRDHRIILHDPWNGAVRGALATAPPVPPGGPEFSADGCFAAATVPGNRIEVWETASGGEVGRYDAEGPIIRTLLSPQGSFLAMMEDSGRVTVFERASRQRRVLSPAGERSVRYHFLSFSSDETLLAIYLDTAPGGPQPPEVWDVATGRQLRSFPGRQDLGEVAFVPSSRSLIVRGGSRLRIWRLDPPGEADAMAGHAAEAWAAAFAPGGTILATGSDDTHESQTIKLWNAASGRLLAGWKAHTATVAALAFSPDGNILASASLDSGTAGNPNVLLWDVASRERLASLQGHTNCVRAVAFSPDGRWLATASDDQTVRLWDVATKASRAVLFGHTRNLTSIAFSPDGRLLATGSNDATVRIWDAATGQTRVVLRDVGNVNAVAFAPDGARVASTNEAGEIKLWDPGTGEMVRIIRSEADQLRCLAFSRDGREVVAAGKGKVIRAWDVVTGQELLTLEGHPAQINGLAFSPDGSILASAAHDGSVRLWRAGP